MATRIIETIHCDICDIPTPDDRPMRVAVGNRETVLDLCDACRATLVETSQPWLNAGS